MKRLLLLAFAAFFITAGVQAQANQSRRDSTRKSQKANFRKDQNRMENRSKMADLQLTPEQKAKMKALREENVKNRKAIVDDKSLTAQQKKEKMDELRKTHEENMSSVLTPEQRDRMQKYKADGQHNGKKWGHKKGKAKKHSPKKQNS